jgi:hypothetical protein
MRAMTLFWCEKSESTLLSPSSVVLYPFPHFPLPPFQYPHLQCPCEQPCFPFSQRQRGRGDLSPTGKEANPRSKWPDAKIIISFSESLSLCLGLDVWQWPLIPEQHHPSANPRDRGSHGFPIYKMGTAQMQAWRLSKEGACTQSHPCLSSPGVLGSYNGRWSNPCGWRNRQNICSRNGMSGRFSNPSGGFKTNHQSPPLSC